MTRELDCAVCGERYNDEAIRRYMKELPSGDWACSHHPICPKCAGTGIVSTFAEDEVVCRECMGYGATSERVARQ